MHDEPERDILEAVHDGNTARACGLFEENEGLLHVRGEEGRTLLHIAAMRNDVEMVELLVDWSARVDAATESGETALFYACEFASESLVDILIQEGADVAARSTNGESCR